jgi:hypothetical protein
MPSTHAVAGPQQPLCRQYYPPVVTRALVPVAMTPWLPDSTAVAPWLQASGRVKAVVLLLADPTQQQMRRKAAEGSTLNPVLPADRAYLRQQQAASQTCSGVAVSRVGVAANQWTGSWTRSHQGQPEALNSGGVLLAVESETGVVRWQ